MNLIMSHICFCISLFKGFVIKTETSLLSSRNMEGLKNFGFIKYPNDPKFSDRSARTVQTQIRLLLEEQSDLGRHCLLFHLHVFDKISLGLASSFEF